MAFRIEEATIASVQAAYRTGELDCVTLTRAYLDRIAAFDQQGPRLNAFVTLNPGALEDAARLDAAFRRDGAFVGPLHGVPIAIKDQAEIAGLPASFGSVALKGYVPEQDAAIVTKLREAGAVILGKTTMPDFAASWWGFGSVHGETRCAYALDRDSGGSSGGTGSAVAANLALVGVGEDTGGSIRLPSSANNLFGLRVTPGLISRVGLSPLLVTQDTAGPMARTMADLVALLDVLIGYDARDPLTAACRIARHDGAYAQGVAPGALKQARIGVLKEGFGAEADPDCAEVNTTVRGALARMADAGAELVPVSLPEVGEFIADTSLYILQSRRDVNRFLKARPGLPMGSLEEIVAAGLYDPNLELVPDMVRQGPERPEDDPDYWRKLARCQEFQRVLVNLMAANNLDAIAFPACQVLSPTIKSLREGRWTVLSYPTNTTIASQAWLPSLCAPAGFSSGGVPVGLELIAPPYAEASLIALGHAYEQVANPRRSPEAAPEI